MTLQLSHRRAKRRWAMLGTTVVALSLAFAAVAQASLSRTLFELDKDATNNEASTKAGVLNAAVATANDGATTSITICQAAATFANGTIVLVDAEKMSLAGGANVGGGGCPAGFTNKRSYTATRGLGTSVPGDHAKAEDVTLLTAGTDGTMPGNDWDQVYDAVQANANTKCESLGAVACSFIEDGRAESIFTQSKDYDEISGTGEIWKWRDQSVPDADELDHGFAIKYVSGTDQNLYFGADRFAANGTKDAGFWFFHNTVAALDPVGSADGLFSGLHKAPVDGGNDGFCNEAAGGTTPGSATSQPSPVPACTYDTNDKGGDVLVLTTFTGGGAVTTIRVFEWVGPAGAVSALLERGNTGDCIGAPNTAVLCATVNDTTVETKWAYSGKGEPATNEVPSGGFLEGGINLSNLGLAGCFSSFMATTRSSSSLTADPKDFILGKFESCGSTLKTTPKTGAGAGLTADTNSNNLDEVTIGTNGQVTVSDSAALTVTGTAFTGTLDFYVCGPFANPNACTASGVNVGAATGVNPVTANGSYASKAVTLTSVGRYCWFAKFTSGTLGVPNSEDGTIESAGNPNADPPILYSTGECFEVRPVAPTLTTTASNGTAGTAALFGAAIDDLANLSGTARQPVTGGPNATYPTIHTTPPSLGSLAGGTITFKLYGPADTPTCTDPSQGVTGNLVATSVVNPISGDSVVGPPPTYKASTGTITGNGGTLIPPSPGKYYWTASYGGNSPNTLPAPKDSSNAATFTGCGDANETSFVQQIPPSITTDQWVIPNDDATVAVTAGGDIKGSLQFRLYDTLENCQANTTTGVGNGGLLYEQTVNIADDNDDVSGADSETKSTTNDGVVATGGVRITVDDTVWWRVLFTSTNSAHENRLSNCTESTDVDFEGDNTGTGIKPS